MMRKIALLFICIVFQSVGCTQTEAELQNERILFIVSNAHFYGDSNINTSNHFSEIVQAYDILVKAGYSIDFVSPEGGAIPIGYINTSESLQKQYLYDNDFMNLLKTTKKPSDVIAANYKAVYYGGGGAAMFGVADNKEIQNIVMAIYEEYNGLVTTICHGTAGIVNLKTKDGKYLVEGKRINGFPDKFENKEAAYYKTFPFSIENSIKEHGGTFNYSPEGWDGYMEVDDRIITGQDPSAAGLVAMKIVEKLQNKTQKN